MRPLQGPGAHHKTKAIWTQWKQTAWSQVNKLKQAIILFPDLCFDIIFPPAKPLWHDGGGAIKKWSKNKRVGGSSGLWGDYFNNGLVCSSPEIKPEPWMRLYSPSPSINAFHICSMVSILSLGQIKVPCTHILRQVPSNVVQWPHSVL